MFPSIKPDIYSNTAIGIIVIARFLFEIEGSSRLETLLDINHPI